MFKKIKYTTYPPKKAILVWDGDCTFCKFWKTRWEIKTQGLLEFIPYQDCADQFPDIPLKEFKKASRLISSDGSVYSGPDSAYRSLYLAGNKFWHHLYSSQRWFEKLSDVGYDHIAKNRSFYYKMTKLFFGKDPLDIKGYWIIYLVIVIAFIAYVLF